MMYRLLATSVLALAGSISVDDLQHGTRETVITFTSGSLTLEGTLTLPNEGTRWPAAVIIAGSGPTDRNGNSVAGVSTDMYAMLARGLAERGIASLRYDKRALPSRKGSFDMAASTMSDYAADAASAARFLAARPDVGPVSFIGHSEGGSLALIAARDGAPVVGLVLVSSAGRDATTILREQLARQLPPPMMAQFDTAWAAYLRGDSAVNVPPGLQGLFVPINRRFVQSWNDLKPVEILRGLKLPTLVVQGATDVQTTAADAEALRSARPDVELVVLQGVNHVLKLSSGATMQAQLSSYTDRTLPLAPDVVPTIARFILQRAK
jgi:uncharacterized protein